MHATTAPLLLAGLALVAGPAPEPVSTLPQHPGQAGSGPGDVLRSDLLLEHYTPRHAPAFLLEKQVSQLAGTARSVRTENGEEVFVTTNLFAFGDSIVLYDTAEGVASLRALLTQLDDAYQVESTEYVRETYAYKHLSMERVGMLLDASLDGEYDLIEERRVVLIHGERESVSEAVALLRELDQPSQQVLLTCWLIRGTDEPDVGDPLIPGDLTEHLAKLLPFPSFQRYSHALLRTSVRPASGELELWMEPELNDPWGILRVRAGGFDAETATWTLDECTFGLGYTGTEGETLFRTSTNIRAGEYTVLGATGMSPLFVVLRLELL